MREYNGHSSDGERKFEFVWEINRESEGAGYEKEYRSYLIEMYNTRHRLAQSAPQADSHPVSNPKRESYRPVHVPPGRAATGGPAFEGESVQAGRQGRKISST